jgi:hypothetical protein
MTSPEEALHTALHTLIEVEGLRSPLDGVVGVLPYLDRWHARGGSWADIQAVFRRAGIELAQNTLRNHAHRARRRVILWWLQQGLTLPQIADQMHRWGLYYTRGRLPGIVTLLENERTPQNALPEPCPFFLRMPPPSWAPPTANATGSTPVAFEPPSAPLPPVTSGLSPTPAPTDPPSWPLRPKVTPFTDTDGFPSGALFQSRVPEAPPLSLPSSGDTP